MANRFFDNYRPAHDGQSVMGGGMINNPKHPDVQNPYSWNVEDNMVRIEGPNSSKMGGGSSYPNFKIGDFPEKDDPYSGGPAGGSPVPRKPKPSKPSGGFSLPNPMKVGQ